MNSTNNNLLHELNEALKKLTSFIYFDKQGLNFRATLAQFLNKSEEERIQHLSVLTKRIKSSDASIANDLELLIMPKKVEMMMEKQSNFISNLEQLKGSKVTRAAFFIEASIDIHLISVLWTMRYGRYLDKSLNKNCYGNRLDLNNDGELPSGRRLYKKYENQFQNWWSEAINAAKHLLVKGDDVTIVNLDFKDYYHRVELRFEDVEQFIQSKTGDNQILKDPLHLIFKEIHREYRQRFDKIKHAGINLNKDDVCNLPIGLLSSPVLANYYLKDFDHYLQENLNPIHYGRYVDDILIVIKDTLLKTDDEFLNKSNLVDVYFEKHLTSVFQITNDDEEPYRLKSQNNEYQNIIFQKDKLFIYQFDANLSSGLLSKFEKEQRNRSSAFQFLSEDDDNSEYQNIDQITFESNFENKCDGSARFKIQEEKKFEMSVYLAKILRGTVQVGKGYKDKEADKILQYFQGHVLIKGHYYWEKLLTLFFIREEYDRFYELFNKISTEINQLTLDIKRKDAKVGLRDLKKSLVQHLNHAYLMAVGLHPEFRVGNKLNTQCQKTHNIQSDFSNKRLFLSSGLIRKGYVKLPLAQFIKGGPLSDFISFPLYKLPEWYFISFGIETNMVFPYRVKFYELAIFEFLKELSSTYGGYEFKDSKYEKVNFDPIDILNRAWENFVLINEVKNSVEVKKQYFIHRVDDRKEIKEEGKSNCSYYELKNGGRLQNKFRMGLVNKYVDLKEDEKSLEGHPVESTKRLNEFNRILDDITKIPHCDLFIMPEIALPWKFLPNYTSYSVYKQTAINTGLEHIKVGDLGFNFTFTCLPINVEGDKDALPILRLKNHYSHKEEEWIYKKRMSVPRQDPYKYNRFFWRGIFFSEYNCFELANVEHRNLFYGKIDLMLSPIWNKDMHYYNSLIESTSRDLHLPILMCNTSQYGDSRFTMPLGHITRDKVRVKGGNVKDHRSSVLVVDFDVKQLRYFQIHDYSNTTDFNKKYNTDYKPLPPNYPFKEAKIRYNSGK